MSERAGAQRERGETRAGGPALAPARLSEERALSAQRERALSAVLSDPAVLAGRGVRALLRQPWFVAITLVQPVVWLLLFGALFENVVPSPTGDYIAYLTPGIVVMSALFSSGWAGMGFITDAERGVLDRLLVSPVRRGSVMTGSLLNQQVTTVVQTVVILALGYATGARFPGGLPVLLVFVAAVILLAAAFASYSDALALLLRSQESVIGAVNFVVLPLSFLSSMLVPTDHLPGWIATIARWNPVDWAVVIGRQALSADVDWGVVAPRIGGLAALAVAAGALAARSFASYQRSV
jgi:ABC-2 type transport system permease protein